jgi:hypothetical protein
VFLLHGAPLAIPARREDETKLHDRRSLHVVSFLRAIEFPQWKL